MLNSSFIAFVSVPTSLGKSSFPVAQIISRASKILPPSGHCRRENYLPSILPLGTVDGTLVILIFLPPSPIPTSLLLIVPLFTLSGPTPILSSNLQTKRVLMLSRVLTATSQRLSANYRILPPTSPWNMTTSLNIKPLSQTPLTISFPQDAFPSQLPTSSSPNPGQFISPSFPKSTKRTVLVGPLCSWTSNPEALGNALGTRVQNPTGQMVKFEFNMNLQLKI